ncbi:bacteriophage abortive infection AbiH family protein [Pseudidiomarina sediminum]|uniref:bacteriophage abortive infection AbiH family protein n=1 Tax=Pseudidiomarina sediminum TaxID=431675 RepID=UPI001C9852F3|nr:bacteriophage abortive infection AbiH family protein [Pseudidiomarina sediminum]MBY6063561.1 bacteriophage abortive infection AbiH family protein [Pseudidiomarina sediminum]
MKFVYIIGNGFDINLGLKTRYSDFYEYYQKQQTESSVVRDFKQSLLDDEIENSLWSDLELYLGKYLRRIKSHSDFDELIDDIRGNLTQYLERIQDEFKEQLEDVVRNPSRRTPSYFTERLLCPERYLRQREKDDFLGFCSKFNSASYQFDVITFNYTNTIESILGLSSNSNRHENLAYRIDTGGRQRVLSSIYHVHGSVYEDMVLGVNDASQMSNEKFQRESDITAQLVKPECNVIQAHGVESKCQDLLRSCDVVCVFGSSFGETDRLWWDLISEQVESRACKLVIYEFNSLISLQNRSRTPRYKRDVIEKIFGRGKVDKVKEGVMVSFNSDIFKLSPILDVINNKNREFS